MTVASDISGPPVLCFISPTPLLLLCLLPVTVLTTNTEQQAPLGFYTGQDLHNHLSPFHR